MPKTVRNGPFMRPQQWLNRIQERQRDVASHTALSAKALFLGKCGLSACWGEGLKSLRTGQRPCKAKCGCPACRGEGLKSLRTGQRPCNS